MATGRLHGAREELEGLVEELGDVAAVELAFLDAVEKGDHSGALRRAGEIAARHSDDPALRARALHVSGIALERLRRTSRAVRTLLEAADLYLESGNELARSHVYDTLGRLHASRGRTEEATYYYALSLVDKAWAGDKRGMATTIGGLGRVMLRVGRRADALHCFERDLQMARELGDLRAQARLQADRGRALAALERFDEAEEAYRHSLRLAARHGYDEILFFAHVELAAFDLDRGRIEAARTEHDAARATGLAESSSYRHGILTAVSGRLLLEEGDERGLGELESAVHQLARLDAPGYEIRARVVLARAYMARGLKAMAEATLVEGLRRARAYGYRRHQGEIESTMGELALVEPAIEEPPRKVALEGQPGDGAFIPLEKLAETPGGEVWRVHDPLQGTDVALKVVHLGRLYDVQKRRKRLRSVRREVEAASRVRHPGVARVYRLGIEEDGDFYTTQEFVPGLGLRRVMEEEPEPAPARVADLAARLAFALEALHEAGVIHRDLKPENIVVRDDGTPVIVDFGIARMLRGTPIHVPRGRFAGTLEYAAPELIKGGRIDERVDLYSLGVIVFEWLVGFRPIREGRGGREAFFEELLETPAPRVAAFLPDVPTALDELVASLLAKRPDDRPKTAGAAARAFRQIAEPPA
jgi:tetratricopeptide (TPR) repeat protein